MPPRVLPLLAVAALALPAADVHTTWVQQVVLKNVSLSFTPGGGKGPGTVQAIGTVTAAKGKGAPKVGDQASYTWELSWATTLDGERYEHLEMLEEKIMAIGHALKRLEVERTLGVSGHNPPAPIMQTFTFTD